MNIDLKSQWRAFYRSLTWRRMARDRIASKILRFWSPIWNGVREIYYQIDLQGIGLRARGLAVSVRGRLGEAKQSIARLRRIRPGLAGAALGILVMAWLGLRAMRGDDEPVRVSAAPLQLSEPGPATAPLPAILPAVVAAPIVDESTRLESEFAQARQKCLENLSASDSYKAAQADADRLEMRVRQLRKEDTERHLPQASLEWIQAKSLVNRMTQDALNADNDVQHAQQALLDHGIVRNGKRIYVFESGQHRDNDATSSVSADDP